MRPLVLYHDQCFDGFAAAWVAHKHFGDDADYLPVQYGQSPPDVSGRDVFILDFSYKRPALLDMRPKASSILVVDHHKTAQQDLADLSDPFHPLGLDLKHPLRCVFDMDKSGGRLTWEHFFPKQSSPWMVDYTEDRDLWRHKLRNSREINAALRSYPMDFQRWDCWEEMTREDKLPLLERLSDEGGAILRREQQIVDTHVRFAREIELDGHKVLCVNATVLISEIAGALAKDRPFGVCWFERSDGKRAYSLRSREGGIDVSEIAKRHGGGGHRNAAGYEI
jgi:oligoribonuclease NrnB/cAMP/cGMP phosphodiesterase (DHH superfamily)